MPVLSVLIPTLNPHPERLRRTLAALAAQTLPADLWETLVVDNASSPPLRLADLPPVRPASTRLISAPEPGLTAARRRGLAAAAGDLAVLVDDDNVLDPGYLATAAEFMRANPRVGAAGGRCVPEFEVPPAPWQEEFLPLLALRDPGDEAVVAPPFGPGDAPRSYPAAAAPVGAGMVLRLAAARPWLDAADPALPDRRGAELTSGGDNDIVLTLLGSGWDVAYVPALRLTHLIPAGRLAPAYLARLNRGIQKSWMQVLRRHRANPWPPVPAWTVPLRQAKAWATYRAWSSPAARIRWQGACGHFEGRAA